MSNKPETPATRRDQIGRRVDAIGKGARRDPGFAEAPSLTASLGP